MVDSSFPGIIQYNIFIFFPKPFVLPSFPGVIQYNIFKFFKKPYYVNHTMLGVVT